jgi:hypothetical protein
MASTKTNNLEEVRRAHRLLMRDLQRLETAAHEPLADGLEKLRTQLPLTRAHLIEHFRYEEDHGYAELIREQLPRLQHAVMERLDEHPQLLSRLEDLLDELQLARCLSGSFPSKVLAWVHEVREHESKENLLIQDAFNRDLGATD